MLLSIELPVAVVLFLSWLLLTVYIHFIRQYGKSGYKVEMCNIYCSVKEVMSSLYIFSHWVCMAIMTYLVIIDIKIDGNVLRGYFDKDGHEHINYPYPSRITHDTKFAIWGYTSLAIYFISGISNTALAVELFTDRGRVPDRNPTFARPDYIGQNAGWS